MLRNWRTGMARPVVTSSQWRRVGEAGHMHLGHHAHAAVHN